MRASFHSGCEDVRLEIETDCCHFSDCHASLNHHVAPAVHSVLPLLVIFGRKSGRVEIFVSLVRAGLAYGPEEAPLGVVGGRLGRVGAIFLCVMGHHFVVPPGLLDELGRRSNLVGQLGEEVFHWLVGVELSRARLEIILHHRQKVHIMGFLDSRVLDDD